MPGGSERRGSTLGLIEAKLLYILQLIAVAGGIEAICGLSLPGARIRYWYVGEGLRARIGRRRVRWFGATGGSWFDLRDFSGPDARCPLAKTGELWRVALEATGDPAFGAKLAKYFTHTTFHALGYGLSASSTPEGGLRARAALLPRGQRCHGLPLLPLRGGVPFLMEPLTEVPIESVDALVGMYLRMCRSLIGRDFSPLADRTAPPAPGGAR